MIGNPHNSESNGDKCENNRRKRENNHRKPENNGRNYESNGRKRSGIRWWRIALLVVLLGLAWTGFVQWKIASATRTDSPASADVAIVLGAALWNDEPSPGLRERLDHAWELYREGRVPRLVVSGGRDANGSTLTEAEGMKRYLVGRGVPEQDVITENEARSTYENLLFSRRIMEQNGWQRAVIVTHHYHAARALDIARFLGYREPQASTAASTVMYMPRHLARETLAFTKWELDKLLLTVGWKPVG
jgi:uncharacterized SAM-binding protein YcdF (DUF218 family)